MGEKRVRWSTALDDDLWVKEELSEDEGFPEPGVKEVSFENVGHEEEKVDAEKDVGGDPGRLGNEKDKVLKKMTDPMMPTKAEVEEHRLRGHIPYRNWCGICVKAMRKDRQPFESTRDRSLPEYS